MLFLARHILILNHIELVFVLNGSQVALLVVKGYFTICQLM